jgi:thioredoxin-like negative regulator of GroEL
MNQASLQLAELYRLEGRPLRALATLGRLEASLTSPDQQPPQLRYQQAIALHALGRFDAAVERFQQARQRLGDDAELLLMLADCQFRSGHPHDARATFERLAELVPDDPRVGALQAQLKTAGHQIAGTL